MSDSIPKDIRNFLDELASGLSGVLDNRLTGIYLYGSLTQRAFVRGRSDIDCIVVLRRPLSTAKFGELVRWFAERKRTLPLMALLQATFLVRDRILEMNGPGWLYQFGKLASTGSDGNPIPWLNILESGITIHGEAPTRFVPKIGSEALKGALRRELTYLKEEIANKKSRWRNKPKYRAYAVLTCCRILCTQVTGRIVSKHQAATYAYRHLPKRFHDIVRQSVHASNDKEIGTIPLRSIKDLLANIEGSIGEV